MTDKSASPGVEAAAPRDQRLRTLLEDAFECGHMAWPTPDLSTRLAMRDHVVSTILARAGVADWTDRLPPAACGAASKEPKP